MWPTAIITLHTCSVFNLGICFVDDVVFESERNVCNCREWLVNESISVCTVLLKNLRKM